MNKFTVATKKDSFKKNQKLKSGSGAQTMDNKFCCDGDCHLDGYSAPDWYES